jgi:hypothetical protein
MNEEFEPRKFPGLFRTINCARLWALAKIDHEADAELLAIKFGLDELEVSAKVRPERPNPGSCMSLRVERK